MMQLSRTKQGKCILKRDAMFIENIQRFADLFAAMTHFVEGLSLGTLLTLKVE
jgi:hypothetical protein